MYLRKAPTSSAIAIELKWKPFERILKISVIIAYKVSDIMMVDLVMVSKFRDWIVLLAYKNKLEMSFS